MGINETFQILSSARSEQVTPTLLAALDQEDARVVKAAVTAIVQTRSAIGYHELLKRYRDFPPEVRDVVSRGIYRMHDELVEFISGGSKEMRRTILDILANSTSVDTLDLLVMYLTDDDPAIRQMVSNAIAPVVARFATEKRGAESAREKAAPAKITGRLTGVVRTSERVRKDLDTVLDALKTALGTLAFHQSMQVVLAACSLGEDGHQLLMEALKREGGRHSSRDALVTLLKAMNDACVFEFMFELLGHEMNFFRSIGVEIFEDKRGPEAAEAALAVLYQIPAERQRLMIRYNQGAPWLPLIGPLMKRLPADYAKLLYKEIERLEMPSWKKAPYWAALIHAPDDEIETACLNHLTQITHESVHGVLASLLDTGSEQVQLKVMKALADSGSPELQRLLAPKVSSDSEPVRKLASSLLSRSTFAKYVDAFDRLDTRTRKIAGEAFGELDEAMVERLMSDLNHVDPAKRLKAIHIIQTTGGSDKMGEYIVDLVNDPDKKVRATIVQLLAAMRNTEAIKALVKLLSDPDVRVQANAVEAIEELKEPRLRQVLVPLLRHPNNRVRGNVCKALWTLGVKEVAPIMLAMLDDPNGQMRMTGAWALRECRPEGALEKLKAAIKKEEDEEVLSRMVQAAQAIETPGAPAAS